MSLSHNLITVLTDIKHGFKYKDHGSVVFMKNKIVMNRKLN